MHTSKQRFTASCRLQRSVGVVVIGVCVLVLGIVATISRAGIDAGHAVRSVAATSTATPAEWSDVANAACIGDDDPADDENGSKRVVGHVAGLRLTASVTASGACVRGAVPTKVGRQAATGVAGRAPPRLAIG